MSRCPSKFSRQFWENNYSFIFLRHVHMEPRTRYSPPSVACSEDTLPAPLSPSSSSSSLSSSSSSDEHSPAHHSKSRRKSKRRKPDSSDRYGAHEKAKHDSESDTASTGDGDDDDDERDGGGLDSLQTQGSEGPDSDDILEAMSETNSSDGEY